MATDLRFGIVGAGSIAEFHAKAIQQTAGARLVACTTRTPARAAAFAARYDCAAEPDLAALLARRDIDAIAITTPSGTHGDIGAAAAAAGKHVLCEKPLDVTVGAADRLIAACEGHRVTLGCVFQSRFGAGARAVREAVRLGRFGRLSQCSVHVPWYRDDAYYRSAPWRGTRALDGGALFNQGAHAVDLALWLVGDVDSVSASVQTRIHDIEAEDNAVAWLQFACGSLGVVQSSTACFPGAPKRVELRGERGSAVLEDDEITAWQFADAPGEAPPSAPTERAAIIGGGSRDPMAISLAGHAAQYADFVQAVADGREPAVTGRDARRSVALIAAIYQSSRSGQVVQLGSAHD